jgi:hypothetical protein
LTVSLVKHNADLQNKAIRKILGVFHTAPIAPSKLEAGLLPPSIRLERLSALYSVRTRDLPRRHPVAKAIKNTVLPAGTRPLGNGDYEILQHKEKTQL